MAPGQARQVQLHDGSEVILRKIQDEYDTADRIAAMSYIQERQAEGEVVTGLLFLDPDSREYHDTNGSISTPLRDIPFEDLCPGNQALDDLQKAFA